MAGLRGVLPGRRLTVYTCQGTPRGGFLGTSSPRSSGAVIQCSGLPSSYKTIQAPLGASKDREALFFLMLGTVLNLTHMLA